jgi:hypothetical protein
MPKFLENALRHEASKKGKTGRAADRYVYGTLNTIGALHGNKETAKGRAMDAKHTRDVKASHGGPENHLGHLSKKHPY